MASIRWNDACQIVRLHHPSASQEAICWCGSGCLSLACLGASMFLWKPGALSQSWSGSLHASSCRSKVFTSISEGVWVIWKGPSLCQSPLEWQTVFILFGALLLWGCLCLADVYKCLGLACLRISLGVSAEVATHPPVTFSANHRKLAVPWEIFHIRYVSPLSTLFCFDAFRGNKEQSDPLVHYLSVSLTWASLWCCCWSPLHRTDILNISWENISHCVYNRHEWGH